jgi:Amt family ammonium transporter
VPSKNIINTLQMSMVSAGIITILWGICSYSFAFGPGTSFWGNGFYAGLHNVGETPNDAYVATVPELAFWVYQLMFAIITPALISGSVVGRMSFRAWILFIVLWSLLVYDPVAHWVWSAWYDDAGTLQLGWIRKLGALDFAGGTVVHIISGVAGLVTSIFLGPRAGYPNKAFEPHNIPMVVTGTAILWFGWFGFNAGSALSAGGLASLAFVNTQISAATAWVAWALLEYFVNKGKVTMGGSCTGAVIGLVVITPAAGYVETWAAYIMGIIGVLVSFSAAVIKKKYIGQSGMFGRVVGRADDALDAFICHGLGGTTGALLTGLFATTSVNPYGFDGAFYGNGKQFGIQLAAVLATAAWSAVFTSIICLFIKFTIGLRVEGHIEEKGIDHAEHLEKGYVFDDSRQHPNDEGEVAQVPEGSARDRGLTEKAELPRPSMPMPN